MAETTKTTIEAAVIRAMAQQIVTDLMTNGDSNRAVRLVLMDASGRDLGGWGYKPLVDRIEKHLKGEAPNG